MSDRSADIPGDWAPQRPYLRIGVRIGLIVVLFSFWLAVLYRDWFGMWGATVLGLAILAVAVLNGYYVIGLWNGDYDAEPMPISPPQGP